MEEKIMKLENLNCIPEGKDSGGPRGFLWLDGDDLVYTKYKNQFGGEKFAPLLYLIVIFIIAFSKEKELFRIPLSQIASCDFLPMRNEPYKKGTILLRAKLFMKTRDGKPYQFALDYQANQNAMEEFANDLLQKISIGMF